MASSVDSKENSFNLAVDFENHIQSKLLEKPQNLERFLIMLDEIGFHKEFEVGKAINDMYYISIHLGLPEIKEIIKWVY